MNYNKMLYTTNKIIENEFIHVQDEALKGMEDLEKYKKIIKDNDERYSILMKALPKEMQEILMQFSDTCGDILTYEIQHYFKKGVVAGTSNLNFLRNITNGINF
ncbi:hypothetical protein [Clostridium beijerinckii]|uniref:Uncharacterized protein n=1 Tax=Clostridium beijerinckii TaxID=1520 RepID=A0A1S8SAS2_CLOBE|nr:hypothetical protein [Clostridium beijerinckii]MBE6089534.1 hypothetical protein [Clostridium beijerinckii]NRY60883.1 hypothetical protein [Clostridium beijerinckii]OOM62325.1 hypothetical protein CLBCK_18630 [Clostridium beijerinckii]